MTDKKRNELAGIPEKLTIVDKKSVKKVKLATKPMTTPNGLCLLSASDEAKIIGSNGKIQGDKTVTIPAKKEKPINNNISLSP